MKQESHTTLKKQRIFGKSSIPKHMEDIYIVRTGRRDFRYHHLAMWFFVGSGISPFGVILWVKHPSAANHVARLRWRRTKP